MSGFTIIRGFLTLLVCFSIGHAIVKFQEHAYYNYSSRNGFLDVVSLVVSFLLGFIYLYMSIVDPFSAEGNGPQHPRPWGHIRLTFATFAGSIVLLVWNSAPTDMIVVRWPYLVWASLTFLESCASFYCWKIILFEQTAAEVGCDDDKDWGEGQVVEEEVMTYQGMEEGRMRRDAQGRLVSPVETEVGGSLYDGKVELDENDHSHDPAPMSSLAEGSPGSLPSTTANSLG